MRNRRRVALVAQDADVDAIAAEIETSVQHGKWASFGGSGFDAGSVSPEGSFIAFRSGSAVVAPARRAYLNGFRGSFLSWILAPMANSEVVARLWREAPGTIDERWLDWCAENAWSPEITWRAIQGAPDDVGLIRGPERLRRYHLEGLELFEEVKVDIRELRDVGERVVARVLLSARSRSTGMPLEIDFAIVYELDPTGRIVAGREYKTEAEAVRAAEVAAGHHEATIRP